MNGNYFYDESLARVNKTGFIGKMKSKLSGESGHARDGQNQEVREALKNWKDSVNYFENAKDPELVDFAIYDMEAAKRRYIFLLRHSKGIDMDMN